MQTMQSGTAMGPSIYTDGSYLASTGSWHEQDSPWKAEHVEAMLQRNGLQPEDDLRGRLRRRRDPQLAVAGAAERGFVDRLRDLAPGVCPVPAS